MSDQATAKKKLPFGFYVPSVGFSFERFAFYSAKWLLAAFVVAKVADGGLGISEGEAAKMQANLVAFTYLCPLFGSIISDRFIGARYLVPIGMILMGIGYIFGYFAQSAVGVYMLIILVSLGTGLFKPQSNGITGRLITDKDQLNNAFSTQYSFVNIGSFIGTTVIGVLATSMGYRVGFLICAAIMFIAAIWFVYGWRWLGEAGRKPFKVDENAENAPMLDEEAKLKKAEEKAEEKKPLTALEKKRVGAIILISFFSIIFWVFWYLAYMPVYYHWGGDQAAADWFIGNFEVPTAWFDSLNALACIVLGPVLGALWARKAKSPKGDISMFKKTALGIGLLGLSYIVFATAEVVRGQNQASLLWIVVFGLLLSLGEMVFSPLGNSFIAKFAPARLLSAMMSVWVLAIFFAGKSYGWLYEFSLQFAFAPTYYTIAAISLVCAVILWVLSPKFDKLVISEEEETQKEVQ